MLDGHITSMPAPARASAAGPSRLVSASSPRSIAEGLACSSTCASGGHTAAPRRSASSRSVSACGPNLTRTVSGWLHSDAASTIRLGSLVLRNCSTSRNPGAGGSPASGAASSARFPSSPRSSSSLPRNASSSGNAVAAGTASIRRLSRAPADSPSVVSASQSARSLTPVGSVAANAVDAVVLAAAGDRAIVSAIASHRSRTSASGERSRIGREPGTASACAAAGNAAASSRSQLRSDGSSGPARQASMSPGPTVGSSRPRATRPTPAAAAAAQTRTLRRIPRASSLLSSSGSASATGMSSAETMRLRMP